MTVQTASLIATIVIFLIGSFVQIGRWAARVTSELQIISERLRALVDRLEESSRNHDSLERQVQDHETRIVRLEVTRE